MKKTLVTLLALVFVLSIAATAMAAPANPFVDVPAKHWSYGAVSKLAKAGVVDGYGDGTFRGDKTMTRYEMAQIVAKAMAKSEKADAELKALIDKLAVEFAAELNNLGVRVAKLEANQSNIKLKGNFSMRYTMADYTTDASKVQAEYRLRLDGTAKVDDKTTVAFRFVTREPDKANLGNNTWQTFGDNGQSGIDKSPPNYNNIDRINLTTKVGDVTTTVGRQALYVDSLGGLVDSSAFSYDGAKFGWKSGDFNFTANWGRFLKDAAVSTSNNAVTARIKNLDVASFAVGSQAGKLDYTVSYWKFNNPSFDIGGSNTEDKAAFKWFLVDTKYTFDKKLTLQTWYVKNSAEKIVATSGDTAWYTKLTIGDYKVDKKGANNLYISYLDKKANAFFNGLATYSVTTGNKTANNVDFKLWTVGYNYGFSKAWSGTVEYGWTKPQNTLGTNEAKQLRFITSLSF